MKTLKFFALVSFIVMCLTITFVNISTPVNAKPYISNGINGSISYETKHINMLIIPLTNAAINHADIIF
jgi:hypothetical protein